MNQINIQANNKNTAAIVVTYNRSDLLKECLLGLINQGSVLHKIYVINNCSTDNTFEVLKKFNLEYPGLFSIITLDSNTGGAGGFHSGVKAAYEDGYKWFWLMDDDVEPYNNALEKLLEFKNISKCIHGKRTSPNGTPHYWEARFHTRFGIAIPSSDKSFKSGKNYCSVNVGCFEGMLIHRDIVERIGFPDPRFFIAWDDTIYGYLASKHTDVIYVDVPVLKRKRDLKFIDLGFRKLTVTSDLYRYYHTRNRGLVKSYIRKEQDFNSILFDFTSFLFAIKELLRAIILEQNFKAYKPIFKGVKDSQSIHDT